MTTQPPFPYMKFYVADYLADTQTLTVEQHGAYLLLLFAMWREGGSVPDDARILASIAHVSTRRWNSEMAWVLHPYLIRAGGRVFQNRLTLELDKARETFAGLVEARRKAGKKRALTAKRNARGAYVKPEP